MNWHVRCLYLLQHPSDTRNCNTHGRKWRIAKMKLFVISACFGIFCSLIPLLVDDYPTIAGHQPDPVSSPLTLLLLGSSLAVLAFWGKRPKKEE